MEEEIKKLHSVFNQLKMEHFGLAKEWGGAKKWGGARQQQAVGGPALRREIPHPGG